MSAFALEHTLQEVLSHLHDPSYSPPDEVWQVLGVQSGRTTQALYDKIVNAIQAMQPAPGIPATSRMLRYYQLLSYRYVQELTQKETARRLQISPRHLRREQQQAVQALARYLWEQHAKSAASSPSTKVSLEQSTPRAEQVHREMMALHDSDPNTTAQVFLEMSRVVRLMQGVLAGRPISLSMTGNKELEALVHPSILRQILITALEDLAACMDQGHLELRTCKRRGGVEIALIGDPIKVGGNFADAEWIILAAQSGSAEFYRDGSRGVINICFPLARQIAVLVIDDNDDVAHVFRRYTLGTRYQVQSLPAPSPPTLQQIVDAQPDIIVLDVLMPNIDGWELLTGLRQHPTTKDIPVIVCSVIHRAELAHTLGAVAHLSKPVKMQQFLETLDQVCQIASVGESQGGMSPPQ